MLDQSQRTEIFAVSFKILALLSAGWGLWEYRTQNEDLLSSFVPTTIFLIISFVLGPKNSNFLVMFSNFDLVNILGGFAVLALVISAGVVIVMQLEKSKEIADSLMDYVLQILIFLGGRLSYKMLPVRLSNSEHGQSQAEGSGK